MQLFSGIMQKGQAFVALEKLEGAYSPGKI